MLDTQDVPPPWCSSRLLAKAHGNSSTNDADTANTDKLDCTSSQHSDSPRHDADKLPFLADNINLSSGSDSSPELPADNLSSFPSLSGDANHNNCSNSSLELPADNLPSFPSLSRDANHDNCSDNLPELSATNPPPLEGNADINPADNIGTNSNDGNKSATPNNTAPSPFPQNEKTVKADNELALIRHHLLDPRPLPHLRGDVLTRFLCRAARFSLAEGRLWKLQAGGQHQLYVALPLCFSLICDAHNNLGHKGVYSMHRTLLDRFWWPSLEGDVKWYVGTCHQCQLRQTTQVCILPTVAAPAPLFCKAYIDTMFMPLTSGFWYIAQA
jgi:hypothetical protein